MDIALKQRLVGATVLVALGVIFIPMLLDGPGSGNGARDTIRIPTRPGHRFESRLLPVDPQEAEADAAQPNPHEPPVVVPQTNELIPVETPPPASIKTAAVPPKNKAITPVATVSSRPVATSSAIWVLQLGSFGNAANAARLVESLQQQSLAGYQEKVAVGDASMYRVRIGTWPTKDQAAEAGVSVSAKFPSLDISVRQIDPQAGASVVAVTPGTGWMVQVGSFSQQQNALVLRDKLRVGGFAAAIEQADGGSYKVMVGPALSRSAAGVTRDRLKQDFAINGIVLSHP